MTLVPELTASIPKSEIAKDPKLEKLPELREELNALEADERSDFIEKA